MESQDTLISNLVGDIDSGKIQLPEFQRSWVWDDYRIKSLLASISSGYPIGAAMFLECGNNSINFKYRTIENCPDFAKSKIPDYLILDGQQRLTSVYAALYSQNFVNTKTDKGKEIKRYYYFDIEKCLDENTDRIDAIISVDENRAQKGAGINNIILDLSSQQKEFENKMIPANILLNPAKFSTWQTEYLKFHNYDSNITQQFMNFLLNVQTPMTKYSIPIIRLDKNTPKEAVCQVFENVNTGGVSLTVFELVTAMFAADNFNLRENWEKIHNENFTTDILSNVQNTDFLTAITLLVSYKKFINGGSATSCKRKDVLKLKLDDYNQNYNLLINGFIEADEILQEERIFTSNDLPYSTQLIPLAVICSVLKEKKTMNVSSNKEKIKQWYWCGVLGELYGGANETRYVNDVIGVLSWIENGNELPKTVNDAYFSPLRLLDLQTRLSAGYKGIMALILKNHCKDFISGREMDFAHYFSDRIDIHHIFPQKYCEDKYDKKFWNSIINKTPISYDTNRSIGGVAPSQYLSKIEKEGKVSADILDSYIASHLIDSKALRNDNFEGHIIYRAKKLLDAIENAMGKTISGRDSDEVINAFGKALN